MAAKGNHANLSSVFALLNRLLHLSLIEPNKLEHSGRQDSPSPINFWTNSDPDTLMKVQSVWWATALASRVFPVPGGPYRSTPYKHIASTPLSSLASYSINLYLGPSMLIN